jgi:hypothetical protein
MGDRGDNAAERIASEGDLHRQFQCNSEHAAAFG